MEQTVERPAEQPGKQPAVIKLAVLLNEVEKRAKTTTNPKIKLNKRCDGCADFVYKCSVATCTRHRVIRHRCGKRISSAGNATRCRDARVPYIVVEDAVVEEECGKAGEAEVAVIRDGGIGESFRERRKRFRATLKQKRDLFRNLYKRAGAGT